MELVSAHEIWPLTAHPLHQEVLSSWSTTADHHWGNRSQWPMKACILLLHPGVAHVWAQRKSETEAHLKASLGGVVYVYVWGALIPALAGRAIASLAGDLMSTSHPSSIKYIPGWRLHCLGGTCPTCIKTDDSPWEGEIDFPCCR